MNIERLQRLADFLDSPQIVSKNGHFIYEIDDDPFVFNMDIWLEELNDDTAADIGPDEVRDAYSAKGLEEPYHCGSIGCIHGIAQRLFGVGEQSVVDALGIDRATAEHLFMPHRFYDDSRTALSLQLAYITAAEAVAVIRHLIKTGEVDWHAAIPYAKRKKPSK